MTLLALSFISASLLMVQDSVVGIDCSMWQNSGNPMSAVANLEHFSTTATRQLNCYRTLAGLPDLKRASNFNEAEEEALMEKVDNAIKDVVNELDNPNGGKPAQTTAPVTQAQNTNTKAGKQEAAKNKVKNGAASVVVDSGLLSGENFAHVLFNSIGLARRTQYGWTTALHSNDDFKAILSPGVTMVSFNAACLQKTNQFVAIAQYNQPIDANDQSLQQTKERVSARMTKALDPCKDAEVIKKERDAAAIKSAASKSLKPQQGNAKVL